MDDRIGKSGQSGGPDMGAELRAYYRVSSAKQGASGLGLEGQQAAVRAYAGAAGGTVLRVYTEVETGRHGGTTDAVPGSAGS
jgi:hypothetical protein